MTSAAHMHPISAVQFQKGPIGVAEIEMMVQKELAVLKFISKVGINQKLDTKNLTLQEDNWFNNKIIRNFVCAQESRNALLDFLSKHTDAGIEICKRTLPSQTEYERQLGMLVLTSLKDCKQGIDNIKNTYRGDEMMVSRLESLWEVLNAKIFETEKLCVRAAK